MRENYSYHAVHECFKCAGFQVLDYNTALTGNGAEVLVYADGEESLSERRGADESVAGNQLSGTFTLTLRGWETDVRVSMDASRLYITRSYTRIDFPCHVFLARAVFHEACL